MSAAENKKLLRSVFEELAKGNGAPFMALWADDFSWTVIGSTKWSGTYSGRDSVGRDLMAPLFSKFATRYTSTAVRLIAEDDFVVVECIGKTTTNSGEPYNNTYCYICRMDDGLLKELKEYSDTALIERVLGDPRATSSADRRDGRNQG